MDRLIIFALCVISAVSTRPRVVKKIIAAEGGVLVIDDVILYIGNGCLAEDTEIAMIKDDQRADFKSLQDMGLIQRIFHVIKFLPSGQKFLKPADLTINFQKSSADSELLILHGTFDQECERVVWELVTNNIEESTEKGIVNVKIHGFCFYCFILAMRGVVARILSHVNHSFSCCAYAFHRRVSQTDKIDISVVLVSDFVDEHEEKDIKQVKDHHKKGYVEGDKGMLKRVSINYPIQVSLDFPGIDINTRCVLVKVDQPELDSVGYVIDYFKGSAIGNPASGTVNVSEVHSDDEINLLWKLNINELKQDTDKQEEAHGKLIYSIPCIPYIDRSTVIFGV